MSADRIRAAMKAHLKPVLDRLTDETTAKIGDAWVASQLSFLTAELERVAQELDRPKLWAWDYPPRPEPDGIALTLDGTVRPAAPPRPLLKKGQWGVFKGTNEVGIGGWGVWRERPDGVVEYARGDETATDPWFASYWTLEVAEHRAAMRNEANEPKPAPERLSAKRRVTRPDENSEGV